jgi:hypothetical protein
MDFLKTYYQTEGPLGFPMTEKQARNLDILLKQLHMGKEFAYKKTVFAKAPTELNEGERSDVSWISTEAVDRYGHVVFAKGMNDSQFALNPIVTLNHNYSIPPIGRSIWRKVTKDGDVRGVKAKTVYPAKPEAWGNDPWPPDKVLTLIQAGLLNGKSIGWLPTKGHFAESKECVKNNWPDGTLVIEDWLLVEYAVGTIPVNPETVVEIVSKAAPMPKELCDALGWDEKIFKVSPQEGERGEENNKDLPERIRFTPLNEIEKAINRAIESIDFTQVVNDVIDRKRGKV